MRYGNLLALVLAMCLPAQPQCSQDMIRGTWVDSMQGVLMMNVPGSSQPVPALTAGLTIMKIDWQGHFTQKGTLSIGGQISLGEADGTLQVNPDCTATATFTMTPAGMPQPLPGQGIERLVIVNNGSEMRSMPTQTPMGAAVQVETLRRISMSEPQCSNATVVGTYGSTWQGYMVMTLSGQTQPTAVPVSYLGAGAVDYQGRMTGGGTFAPGGTIMDVSFPNATVEIHPDCTGTVTWSMQLKGSNQPIGQGMDWFVALDNGDELILLTVQTAHGSPITLGSMKRISSVASTAPGW